MRTTTTLFLVLAALATVAGCGGDDRANPSGTFEATDVDISPKMAGQLLVVGPHEGDRVATGDTLLVTDTTLVQLKRTEAAAALDGIAARRKAATADRAQVQRSLDLARLTLQRLDSMHGHGNATAQQRDEAEAQADILARKVTAAQQNIAVLDAEAARLQATLKVFDRQLHDGVIVSPLDATVLLRTAEPGEMGAPGAVTLRLADLRRLDLRFYLDETDLGKVKLGQALPVQVDAFPGRTFQGEVTWISSEAEFTPKNAQTRDARAQLVFAVKLTVPNPDGALAVGMPAEVLVGK
jgi:HlyD family secretion protein